MKTYDSLNKEERAAVESALDTLRDAIRATGGRLSNADPAAHAAEALAVYIVASRRTAQPQTLAQYFKLADAGMPVPPSDYAARVEALEAEGLTTSDAQAVADTEAERLPDPPAIIYLDDCAIDGAYEVAP